MNPLHPLTSVILGRLGDQTHLHLVLLSTAGAVTTVFEYENSFNFNAIKAGVDGARVTWLGYVDFDRAKQAYESEYDVYSLLAGEYD
jgi:hypothetical protein